jgi:hypothetical protein
VLDTWVRTEAVDLTNSFPVWDYKSAPWTLSVPVTSFEVPYNMPVSRGSSFKIDGMDAALLRSMRKAQAGGMYSPAFVGTFIPVRSGEGRLYGVYLRDGLPFEDGRGLVTFPSF